MKKLRQILESDFMKSKVEERNALTPLHESLSEHYNNYSAEHENEIVNYTDVDEGINSKPLNNYHWEKYKGADDTASSEENKARTKVMDSAIQQHKTPHKLTVYAGIKYSPEERMNKDRIVHHPAYLSTSLSKNTAKDYAKVEPNKPKYDDVVTHLLKIHVPKGHPGAYVDHVSSMPGEKEFILPRGTNLKYSHTEKHDLGYNSVTRGNKHIYEHHMSIV